MARRACFSKPTYRFFSVAEERQDPEAHAFEFDESDVWNLHLPQSESRFELKKTIPNSRNSKKSVNKYDNSEAASSMPVSIPDWSKILREEDSRRKEELEGEESDEDNVRIPPHEFLAKQFARTRVASFSVHEGIGRKLKGRDLSRVRNAIWEKTGFQD